MGDDEQFTEWLEKSNHDTEFRSHVYKLLDENKKLVEENEKLKLGKQIDEEKIDNIICEILYQDGPDGHVDGHEIITSFIKALLEDNGDFWVANYTKGKNTHFLADS